MKQPLKPTVHSPEGQWLLLVGWHWPHGLIMLGLGQLTPLSKSTVAECEKWTPCVVSVLKRVTKKVLFFFFLFYHESDGTNLIFSNSGALCISTIYLTAKSIWCILFYFFYFVWVFWADTHTLVYCPMHHCMHVQEIISQFSYWLKRVNDKTFHRFLLQSWVQWYNIDSFLCTLQKPMA